MATINLTLKKSLFVPLFFPMLFNYDNRWEVYMGSSGSGKSYFIVEKLIVRACFEPLRILVCRKTGGTLRNSCFSLFKEVLDKWQIRQYVSIRETDMNIKFPNGSEIIFIGLDEETKLLSINNISTVWVEEAYEVQKSIVEQLNLRMRGDADKQQIIMSFNPINKHHWLHDFCEVNPPRSFVYIHSTYKDNPFIPQAYRDELDEMETRNPDKYRVFGRGEWGIDSEGLVIKRWHTEDFDAMQLAQTLEHRAGMDMGWIDPSAIIETLYDKANKRIYVFNEFYKSGCQLSDLVKAIEDMNLTKTKIYVDSAEPRSISYLKSQRIRAEGCAKGKDSVKNGLMFLQDHTIIVHPSCVKFIMELENFSYIKSKQTGEWTEDTTHEFSHAIDACRYAYSDIYTNKQVKTMSKSALGL